MQVDIIVNDMVLMSFTIELQTVIQVMRISVHRIKPYVEI